MDMADQINNDNIFDISIMNINEYILNDNNILSILNNTLFKLNEINENSVTIFDEPNEQLIKDILKKYNNFNDDYFNFFKKFEKVLKFEDLNFIKYLNDYINFSANLLFKDFNNTLYSQKNKYDFYNIKNISIFKDTLMNYYNLIQKKLESIYDIITNLKNKYNFKNILNNYLSVIQSEKVHYFKNKLNQIGNNYNLHALNITLDIGKYFEDYINNNYEELKFEYIFDYISLYDNNVDIYIEKLVPYFNDYKKRTLNTFFELINKFLNDVNNDKSNFVDNNYIIENEKNYTKCIGYDINLLNQTIEEDKVNYQKYLKYQKLIEFLDSNCSSAIINDSNFIDINCSLDKSEIKEIIYFNKTEHLLFCDKNKYFNYSIKLFDNFETEYLNKLNDLINKILIKIENSFDSNLLNNYLQEEFKLNPYDLSEEDILGDFEGYEDMIIFSNYSYNSVYIDYLNDLLINSFKISYTNYINNYLSLYLNENLNIFIFSKINFYTKYLIDKISNEYNYYILLLKNTKELGIGSVNALSNLYKKNLQKNLKFYYEIIEEDALFYIDIFYRKNKYIFKENFINFYIKKLNQYNIEIHALKESFDEIIYNNNFNKTLNKISDELIKENIIQKINTSFLISYNNKIDEINSIIEKYDTQIKNILLTINKNDDNLNITIIIMSYQEILLNQNNKFLFRISDTPFNLLSDFIKNILEPPLIKIKKQYEKIENQILDSISDSLNNFPDYTDILKKKILVDEIFNYIDLIYNHLKMLLLKYGDELDISTNNYINKLIHYTYINGLNTYDEPCEYSFCSINISNNASNINYEESNFNYNFSTSNKSENNYRRYENLKRNKNINSDILNFNEDMGTLSKDDIIYILIETKNIISQLNKTLQINFDSKLKSKLEIYLIKTNGTNLIRLKKTVSMAAFKFSNFLTKDSYKILENQMFKNYYILERYIFNFSNNIKNETYNLIKSIKKTSDYLQNINNYIYDKIIAIYDIFMKLIESKYSSITKDEFENHKRKLEKKYIEDDEIVKDNMDEFNKNFKSTKLDSNNLLSKIFNEIVTTKKSEIMSGLIVDLAKGEKLSNSIKNNLEISVGVEMTLKNFKFDKYKLGRILRFNIFEFKFYVIFPFPFCQYLQIRIIPSVNVDTLFIIAYEQQAVKEDKIIEKFIIDFSLAAEINVNLELGLYFPPVPVEGFEMSFTIGLQGVLGSGRIGVRFIMYLNDISNNINNKKTDLFAYFEYEAIQFYAYILFKIEINLEIFKFSFQFYLYKEPIKCLSVKKWKDKGDTT